MPEVSPTSPANPQEYLNSLIANPTGTHLFEAILLHSPFPIFNVIWCTYFRGKISKLALHPYANFVVARGVSRLDRDGIQNVVAECASLSGGQGFISAFRQRFGFKRGTLKRAQRQHVQVSCKPWSIELLYLTTAECPCLR